MSRFAAITVWDEARIIAVANCDSCPFRERKKYGGNAAPKCHWWTARGRRIATMIPATGFPEKCPLPTKKSA